MSLTTHIKQMKLFTAIASAAVIGASFLVPNSAEAMTMNNCLMLLEKIGASASEVKDTCNWYNWVSDRQYTAGETYAPSALWVEVIKKAKTSIDPELAYKAACNYRKDQYHCDSEDIPKRKPNPIGRWQPSQNTTATNQKSYPRKSNSAKLTPQKNTSASRCPQGTRFHKIKVGGLIKRTVAEGCFTDFQASQIRMQANSNQQQILRDFQRNLNESFPSPVNCSGTIDSHGGGFSTYSTTCY